MGVHMLQFIDIRYNIFSFFFVAWIDCMNNCILNSIIHVMMKVGGRLSLIVAETECKSDNLWLYWFWLIFQDLSKHLLVVCLYNIIVFSSWTRRKHLKLSILYTFSLSGPFVLCVSEWWWSKGEFSEGILCECLVFD